MRFGNVSFRKILSQKVLGDVGQIKLRFSSHMNTTGKESRRKLEIVVKKLPHMGKQIFFFAISFLVL